MSSLDDAISRTPTDNQLDIKLARETKDIDYLTSILQSYEPFNSTEETDHHEAMLWELNDKEQMKKLIESYLNNCHMVSTFCDIFIYKIDELRGPCRHMLKTLTQMHELS